MRDFKNPPSQATPLAQAKGQAGLETPRVTSDELLAGQKEIIIEHGGEEYRLRKTKQGKLILTK